MSLVSILIPVLNEQDNIYDVINKLNKSTLKSTHSFEFIFIDDGSTDNTYNLLKNISQKDNRIKILHFSRNFGSHSACLAGLIHSKGDACIFMSADMQEPPEMILRLIEEWEKGYEVVFGQRKGEKVPLFSKTYAKLVQKFALKSMPEKGTDFFLINRKVVDAIITIREKNTSIFGVILWSGFKQTFVPYFRQTRQRGKSKWTLSKKIKLFIDTFVSFSYFPIRLMSVIGLLFSLIGFIYAAIVIFNRIYFAHPIQGWTSLMVVLLVVSGIQMLMLGILGEYLWRSFDETRQRPPFIISEKTNF